MIIVRLQGGLGNQLFQYAAALALAKHLGTSVGFDLRFLAANNIETTPRDFELGDFNIPVRPIPLVDQLAFGMLKVPFKSIFKYLAESIFSTRFFTEKSMQFDPVFFTGKSSHHYLKGYFQSERYFTSIRNDILKSLPSYPPDSMLANDIRSCNAVSLHIRRGDYASVSSIQKVHGLLPLTYYYTAINYLIHRLEDIHVYVFSDDIAWAKDNLVLPVKTTWATENQLNKSYKDMLLMSLCKHHIIANSSFSWWGAWLSTDSESIVIAPKQWFADEKYQSQSQDIIPDRWITI